MSSRTAKPIRDRVQDVTLLSVMPGLVRGMHVSNPLKDVDGRDEPGHDEEYLEAIPGSAAQPRDYVLVNA
jgi:hypothetical protein